MRKILNFLPWRRRRLEADLARELGYHIERRTEELERSGLSADEARRQAAMELGGVTQVRESVRDQWSWPLLDALVVDLRYAARAMARNPVFNTTAVLSLALGIGANAAIFSLADQVLLRPLPVHDPGRLVHLDWSGFSASTSWGGGNLMSYPLCRDLGERTDLFEGVFCRHPSNVFLAAGAQREQVRAELVSGGFFNVLGVQPELGRLLAPWDDVNPGAHPVVVLSYNYWKNSLGGVPDIVGRTVQVNNHPMEVVGVAPRAFTGVDPVQGPAVWLPAMMTPQAEPELAARLFDRRTVWMHVFARLRADVSAEQARARLQPWFKAMLEEDSRLEGFPSLREGLRDAYFASSISLIPAARGLSVQRDVLARPLLALGAATVLLLLLACLNVAGLLLARGVARTGELTTRLALGASRGRITAQLLVEAAAIVVAGGVFGLIAAPTIARGLTLFYATGVDVAYRLDLRVGALAFLACVLAAAICGLAPARRAARLPSLVSAGDRVAGAAGGIRLRRAIVVGQMALTLILLIGAGLFVQTVSRLRERHLGFAADRLAMIGVDPGAIGYSDSVAVDLMRRLLARLGSVPGVERAAVANTSLLTGSGFARSVTIQAEERVVTPSAVPGLRVSPGFFATVGTRVVMGREFSEDDVPRTGENAYRSVIVNESFARKYFGNRSPIGQRLGLGNSPTTPTNLEIIGVVQDVSYRTIRETQPEHIFLPFGGPGALSADGVFFLRVRGAPEGVFGAVRAAVAEIDRNLPVASLRTLDHAREQQLRSERMMATLSTAFGTVALLLSVIGLYGVIAFVVSRRTREIGLRLALGSTRSAAVWLIVRGALGMTALGTLIAVPVAFVLGGLVEAELYGVSATDASTVTIASLALAMVALIAAVFPAWRAVSVSPVTAFRNE